MFMQTRPVVYGPLEWEKRLLEGKTTDALLSDSSLHRFSRRMVKDAIWLHIRDNTQPGQRGLDAGCGFGQWVWFLNSKGLSVVGLDYSYEMISICSKKFPHSGWITSDIRQMPFPDKYFDFLISLGVIEHDQDGPSRSLQEFRRVLKDNGTVLLTVPLDTPLQRWSHSIQYGDGDTGEFFEYFFTPEDMKNLVEENGLRCKLAIPITHNYAVLFPRQYMKAASNPGFPQNIISRFLNFVAKTTKKSYSMLLVVCEKDKTFDKFD